MLNDENLSKEVRRSLTNILIATETADEMAANLSSIISDVKAGRGSAGKLLRDSSFAISLHQAVTGVQQIEVKADELVTALHHTVTLLQQDMKAARGPAGAAIYDTAMTASIQRSLLNVEAATAAFNENMEAMRHHFLFKGYFKKQEKAMKKAAKDEGQ